MAAAEYRPIGRTAFFFEAYMRLAARLVARGARVDRVTSLYRLSPKVRGSWTIRMGTIGSCGRSRVLVMSMASRWPVDIRPLLLMIVSLPCHLAHTGSSTGMLCGPGGS